VLGDPTANEPQHPLAEGGDDLALILLRVVDELVDDEIGAWSNGKCRAVDEEHLDEAGAGSVDALIEEDRVADPDLVAAAEGVRFDGGRDADLVGQSRARRPGQGQRRNRGAGEKSRAEPV
jgi:hypothetical protein